MLTIAVITYALAQGPLTSAIDASAAQGPFTNAVNSAAKGTSITVAEPPPAEKPKDAPKPIPAVVKPVMTQNQPQYTTAVCQCRGSNESVCLCRRSGVQCHCSSGVGSVWWVDQWNRLAGKTGAKVNPVTGSPLGGYSQPRR